MRKSTRSLARLGLKLLLPALACLAAMPMHAGDPDKPLQRKDETWMAVSDETLDEERGGFDLGGGLMVNFGITRAVLLNGVLVAETSINLGSVTALTPAQSTEFNRQLAALNLIQIGTGNIVEPGSGALGGTIVQNTLNNQHIQNQTVINAATNSMGLMKELNTQSAISDAINRSVGGR
ncbi:hypothetical protein QTI66_10490 [Variovorax sp. J22R133]|uniref:hypothetical protein n=1 Tax=Variovorax brevis TaxID=3053503 RepID=UPI0025754A55|nr:hypothetical protein [Variovorax sp. J22R133]MDM0112576.1 hypothetical protein [Variovorax sp. J22R133]